MTGRDHYAAERLQELKEVKEIPDIERQEIVDIYSAKGFSGKLLDDIVNHITADHELWIDTMMREELNLLPVVKHDVCTYTTTVGTATFSGAILPLIPFFFLSVHGALIVALILSI